MPERGLLRESTVALAMPSGTDTEGESGAYDANQTPLLLFIDLPFNEQDLRSHHSSPYIHAVVFWREEIILRNNAFARWKYVFAVASGIDRTLPISEKLNCEA